MYFVGNKYSQVKYLLVLDLAASIFLFNAEIEKNL